jgi:hypothetical protein
MFDWWNTLRYRKRIFAFLQTVVAAQYPHLSVRFIDGMGEDRRATFVGFDRQRVWLRTGCHLIWIPRNKLRMSLHDVAEETPQLQRWKNSDRYQATVAALAQHRALHPQQKISVLVRDTNEIITSSRGVQHTTFVEAQYPDESLSVIWHYTDASWSRARVFFPHELLIGVFHEKPMVPA